MNVYTESPPAEGQFVLVLFLFIKIIKIIFINWSKAKIKQNIYIFLNKFYKYKKIEMINSRKLENVALYVT